MISFIPKDKEGVGRAGIRAAGEALLLVFVGIPYLIYSMLRGK